MQTLRPRVEPDSFLTLHYRLVAADGADVVSTFGGQPATLSLGAGVLAPAMEQCLIGLTEGAHERFELPAGAAFGPRNPALVQRVSMSVLREHGEPDAHYAVGDVVQFRAPDGSDARFAGVLRELSGEDADWALFDFNHPLAGQALGFEVHVIGVL